MSRPHSCRRLCVLLLAASAAAAQANGFPTLERVLYVQQCMRAHPGPPFEMTSKCSCALDMLATKLTYDEYVSMNTVAKAMSIGGERGNSIRDVPSLEPQLKRYRVLQAEAENACFITSETK